MQGSDARNFLLGRIFGYAAFARAGRLQATPDIIRCVTALVAVMHGKAYLREAAVRVLVLILEPLDTQQLQQVLEGCKGLRELLSCAVVESSPEVRVGISRMQLRVCRVICMRWAESDISAHAYVSKQRCEAHVLQLVCELA